MMSSFRTKPVVLMLAAALVCSAAARAQSTQQQLQQQLDSLSRKQAEAAAAGPPASAAPAPKTKEKEKEAAMTPLEKKFDSFLKGFYGTFDVSLDATTKGIYNPLAYHNDPIVLPNGQYGGFVYCPNATPGGPKGGPYGNVGWIGAMSSNGSSFGYRGSHKISNSDINFIYQVSTSINMAAAPGLQNTWTKSSNTVQGAIGLGDTFIGLQNHAWGRLRFGEMYMPYKTSTDRLNPFGSGLGNYAVVMGNTGGDNRVEFGTQADHVVEYNSPTMGPFSFDVAWAPGQQIDPNNNLPSLGSPDCN